MTTSDNEQMDEQGDEQADERFEEPENRGTPAEEERVAPSQNQARKARVSAPNVGTKRHIEKQSYAAIAASKPSQVPEHPWTQVKYKGRKQRAQQSTCLPVGSEHRGRRILFPREKSGHQMSEADLMLALNEALQRAGEGLHTRFCRVRYSPSGAVSALLTERPMLK